MRRRKGSKRDRTNNNVKEILRRSVERERKAMLNAKIQKAEERVESCQSY